MKSRNQKQQVPLKKEFVAVEQTFVQLIATLNFVNDVN